MEETRSMVILPQTLKNIGFGLSVCVCVCVCVCMYVCMYVWRFEISY